MVLSTSAEMPWLFRRYYLEIEYVEDVWRVLTTTPLSPLHLPGNNYYLGSGGGDARGECRTWY